MPDVRTLMRGALTMEMVYADAICPADIFHEVIAEIVIKAAAGYPEMTEQEVLDSVLQAMLLMAEPAGEC